MNIHEMIKFYRMRDGLSQAELAQKIHVTPAAIGNYESGSRKPKPEIEEALADLFNISIDTLRGIDTERAIPNIEPEHIELIDKFSRLSDAQKKIVFDTISVFLADNNQ